MGSQGLTGWIHRFFVGQFTKQAYIDDIWEVAHEYLTNPWHFFFNVISSAPLAWVEVGLANPAHPCAAHSSVTLSYMPCAAHPVPMCTGEVCRSRQPPPNLKPCAELACAQLCAGLASTR